MTAPETPKTPRSLHLAKGRSPPERRPSPACGHLYSTIDTSAGWQSSTFDYLTLSRPSPTSKRENGNTPWQAMQRPWGGPGTASSWD